MEHYKDINFKLGKGPGCQDFICAQFALIYLGCEQ